MWLCWNRDPIQFIYRLLLCQHRIISLPLLNFLSPSLIFSLFDPQLLLILYSNLITTSIILLSVNSRQFQYQHQSTRPQVHFDLIFLLWYHFRLLLWLVPIRPLEVLRSFNCQRQWLKLQKPQRRNLDPDPDQGQQVRIVRGDQN